MFADDHRTTTSRLRVVQPDWTTLLAKEIHHDNSQPHQATTIKTAAAAIVSICAEKSTAMCASAKQRQPHLQTAHYFVRINNLYYHCIQSTTIQTATAASICNSDSMMHNIHTKMGGRAGTLPLGKKKNDNQHAAVPGENCGKKSQKTRGKTRHNMA